MPQLRECGGCAAKASPAVVAAMVEAVRGYPPPASLLVGLVHPDDASVQILDADRALITTIDVSPPLAADPYVSGAIAAANAVNDVYAMGGQVLSALVLAALPRDADVHCYSAMMSGAQDVLRQCGAQITGGHTVHSRGPLFGLSVTGLVHPDRVWRVRGAQPGDVLVLSKPLGVGLALTSRDPDALPLALTLMQRPVRQEAGALTAMIDGPRAVTDVTGYGLVGHLADMVSPGITMQIATDHIPLLPGAWTLAQAGWRTSAHAVNLQWVQSRAEFRVNDDWTAILIDPQTSGGLLAAIPPGPIPPGFHPIGRVCQRIAGDEVGIVVTEKEGSP